MTPIIAGRFEQEGQAKAAAAALRSGGFAGDDVTIFFVNPPGQHASFPIGGDRDASPGAKNAESGALTGVAVGSAVGAGIGLAATPFLGPAAVVAGAGVGAYAGSLAGALGHMEDKPPAAQSDGRSIARVAASGVPADVAPVRPGGVVVAVRAVEFSKRVNAVNILHSQGAQDIERADGSWQDGKWTDFDPLKPALLVDRPEPEDVQLRK